MIKKSIMQSKNLKKYKDIVKIIMAKIKLLITNIKL